MTTAVDSSVLLDILTDDPAHRAASLRGLREARRVGPVLACPVVWAELRGAFDDVGLMRDSLAAAGVRFDPFDPGCAELAGEMWRDYRRQGGSRAHLIPDFLVGAHALRRGGRLLSRDRGFYRRHFDALELLG